MEMKIVVMLLFFILVSCGGSLSDEQRKAMREKMEENKIVRVTEVEIMEAAFANGRQTIQILETLEGNSMKLDSFLKRNHGRIQYLKPGDPGAGALERQLLDAYLADHSGTLQDNVQKARNSRGDFDSLLYTKPVTRKLADGSQKLDGVWNVWLPKKALVLDIGSHKK
jgi:hypothetical protein